MTKWIHTKSGANPKESTGGHHIVTKSLPGSEVVINGHEALSIENNN